MSEQVSEPTERMTMTKAEFSAFVNESFDSGSLAAFDTVTAVIAELRRKIAAPDHDGAATGGE